MRKPSVPLFKGKNKTQITQEAFETLGANATRAEVDKYARTNYGVTKPIESSMYYTIKGKMRPVPVAPPRKDVFAVIRQVKTLADDVGGPEKLKELVELIQGSDGLERLLRFAESYK